MSSASATTSTLLADPILAPFLAPSFSIISYLNSTLPPLSPPTLNLPTQSKLDPKVQLQQQLSQSHPSNNPNAVPLSQLHPKTTSLLSLLDIQTHKLITHLQSLTDEILRVAPRLGYEVEVLRGGVVALAEDLERMRGPPPPTTTDGSGSTNTSQTQTNKPEVLHKLEALSTIWTRLEEVIAIFGEAMNWPLEAGTGDSSEKPESNALAAIQSPSYYNLSPAPSPPPFIKELNRASSASKTATKTINPAAEVSYLLASNMIPEARARIEQLRVLASVFKGTSEGEARAEIVEKLAKKVAEAERIKEMKEKGFGGMEDRMAMPPRSRVEDNARPDPEAESGAGKPEAREEAPGTAFGVSREGYYGLISQLQRMRGMG
ncbi:hypothetical protein DFH27DRAFT_561612 [Peziza echinospora]|nr:hypothetical protein DFH27DRAFT_561612 [Peziza echinospora]